MKPARHLSQKEIEEELTTREGLIPVDIDPVEGRIVWMDLERYHCYRGFFQNALDFWKSIRGSELVSYSSPLDILDCLELPPGSLAPTGFIFHAGRCGSTLLAQVLARSRENMVFVEASPHNQIWRRTLSGDLPETRAELKAYRNLHLAMGRRRLPSYRSHIVKFTSFNILKFQKIRIAFPGVPALFLFREPRAMLNSYHRSGPSWLGNELGIGDTLATPEGAVEAFFRAALSIGDPDFRCLDYAMLKPESLAHILAFFGMTPSPQDKRLMLGEFSWDGKSGNVPRRFVPHEPPIGSSSSEIAVPGSLDDLYWELKMWKPLLEQGG